MSGASLREALATRVVVADGAMGTMLQAQDPTLEDFEQLEGCNEVLNVTRPDIVRSVHEAYFAVGVDCVETNTFGANLAALRRVRHRRPRSTSCPRPAPGSPARSPTSSPPATAASAGCSARWAPAPSCPPSATSPTPRIRDAYQANAEGLIAGGADALLVETTQDLLQTKAAVLGARRAMDAPGADVPLIVLGDRARPPARCCSAPRSARR